MQEREKGREIGNISGRKGEGEDGENWKNRRGRQEIEGEKEKERDDRRKWKK